MTHTIQLNLFLTFQDYIVITGSSSAACSAPAITGGSTNRYCGVRFNDDTESDGKKTSVPICGEECHQCLQRFNAMTSYSTICLFSDCSSPFRVDIHTDAFSDEVMLMPGMPPMDAADGNMKRSKGKKIYITFLHL